MLIIFRCGKPMGLLGKPSILGNPRKCQQVVRKNARKTRPISSQGRGFMAPFINASSAHQCELAKPSGATWRIIPWLAMVIVRPPTRGCGTPSPSGLNDLWVGVTNCLRTGMTPQVCFFKSLSKKIVKMKKIAP